MPIEQDIVYGVSAREFGLCDCFFRWLGEYVSPLRDIERDDRMYTVSDPMERSLIMPQRSRLVADT